MANDPDTSEVQALDPPVRAPKRPAEDLGADGGDGLTDGLGLAEGVDEGGHVPKDGTNDEVAGHVEETLGGVADEETRGDSGANLTQRPTGEKEMMSGGKR